ncbi:MAG: PQQ-binding-like beta-propeller repeat protein, partial [Dehalococcoidia bacterium]
EKQHWAEVLQGASSSGLFGCSPLTGGCGGAMAVAIYGTPAIGDEFVYIAGYNGRVYAYDQETLGERWRYPRDAFFNPIVGGVVVADGKVIFGDSAGYVYALDAATGDFIWEFATEEDEGNREKIWSTPAVSDGTVYIGSYNKKIYAIDAETGTLKWKYETEGSVIAQPLVMDGTIYIGSCDRNFYALDTSGNVIWSFSAENWFWSIPAALDGKIYAGNLDGKVYVLNPANGTLLDTYDLEEPLSATPVIHNSNVIFATREGKIYSIDTVTRQKEILADLEARTYGPLAIKDGIVYAHTQETKLERINADTGAVLSDIDLKSGA